MEKTKRLKLIGWALNWSSNYDCKKTIVIVKRLT